MNDWHDRLAHNLNELRHRIEQAAIRADRDPREVHLVVVTKYVSAEVARVLVELGQSHLGESRPQELWAKAQALADLSVNWHLVGHLQRNKVRRTLPYCHLLHSADSTRLLDEIESEAVRQQLQPKVLLEVNVSGDPNKHGFRPEEVPELARQATRWNQLAIVGLMTMASLEHPGDLAAEDFARLRQLRDQYAHEFPPPHRLRDLSMGMSGDFEQAIAQGATWLRIGSAVFEGLPQLNGEPK